MKTENPYAFLVEDYYPFGMLAVGRCWESGSEYRYGFNSQEHDDEVYGNGNLNTAEYWEYDTRLGRRWNQDPVVIYFQSPYSAFSGNPIMYIDEFGDKKDWYQHKNDNGTTTVIWLDENSETITIDNQEYENIGEWFTKTDIFEGEVVTETFYQNKSLGINSAKIQQLNTAYNPCHPEGNYLAIAMSNYWATRDVGNGQYYDTRPEWLDRIFGARDHNGYIVSADGYVTNVQSPNDLVVPNFIGGPKGIPKIPKFYKGISIEEQGVQIAKTINTNNVYIRTSAGAKRYSIAGDSHAGVPTPHIHSYQNNYLNSDLKSVSLIKEKPAQMTQQDMRIVRKYLEKMGKL